MDGLRGIAAMMVCLFHAEFMLHASFPEIKSILQFGQEGVSVFFVISGFVIPYSLYRTDYRIKQWGSFMLKRITRLQPPLIVISGFISVGYFLTGVMSGKDSIIGFLTSSTLTAPLVPWPWLCDIMWTLFIELQFYMIIALLFPMIISTKRSMVMLGFLLFGMAALFTPWMSASNVRQYIPMHLPIFMLGILNFLLLTKRIGRITFFVGWAALVVFHAVLCREFLNLATTSTIAAACTSLLLLISTWRIPLLSIIGEFSYSLYLVHWPIFSIWMTYLPWKSASPMESVAIYLGMVVSSIIAAKMLFLLVEKPSMRWAKAWSKAQH